MNSWLALVALVLVRVGPYVQFLLQNLAWATLARAQVPGEVLAEAARGLAEAAGPQALEVRAQQWTAPLFRRRQGLRCLDAALRRIDPILPEVVP